MLRKLLVCCALLGCVPDPDVEPVTCRNPLPASAEIGAGDLATGFKPMDEGAKALVSLGAQGLHMITVSVKLTGFEAPQAGGAAAQLWLSLYQEGKLLGAVPVIAKPQKLDKETVVFLGLRPTIIVDNAVVYFGKPTQVEVTVRDGCDRLIHARKTVLMIQ